MAFSYDAAGWQKLVDSNRREKNLVMSCCGRPAVLKTSHLRTRFFAHARKDGSTCPRESEAHLFAKNLVAKAVVQAGWQAETEAILKPHSLTADVLATKGKQRIAFEIQLSRQKWQDTEKRHAAYEKAGVRALWLFKQADYPRCREVPAFRLTSDTEGRALHVWVWREGNEYEKVSEPTQAVMLQQFIAGALEGKLKWRAAIGLIVPVTARIAQATCRRGHSTPVLASLELDINRVLPGHANPRLSVNAFREHPETLLTAMARGFLEKHRLALHFGVSSFGRGFRGGDENFQRYISACCSKCGQLIGEWELRETSAPMVPSFELSLNLSNSFLADVPELDRQLARWWFDSR